MPIIFPWTVEKYIHSSLKSVPLSQCSDIMEVELPSSDNDNALEVEHHDSSGIALEIVSV